MAEEGHDPWRDDPRVVAYLGDGYLQLRQFAELLADEGVRRGLIGPRELPRLWERHLLNCAAVAPLVPGGTVVDVGSGAGLPGVVIAVLRPDVQVVLLEAMERRVAWLREVVDTLGLNAEVLRGRAEEQHGRLLVDTVTARAVAPLDRLAGWSLPLLRQGGVLLALKGDRAGDELAAGSEVVGRLGGDAGEVVDAGTVAGVPATSVVRVTRVAPAVAQRSGGGRPGGGRSGSGRARGWSSGGRARGGGRGR